MSQSEVPELILLLEKIAQQDKKALKTLYQKTVPKLYAISLRITKQKWLSEEAIQDCFYKVWTKADQFDAEKSSPITWIGTIVRNCSIDLIRKNQSKQAQSIEESPYELVDETPSLEEIASKDNQKKLINHCMDQLDPNIKDIVMLAYNEGYTQQQIADMKFVPIGSVKTWLHRSIKSLKLCVEKIANEKQ